jgi:hypothetical protein
MKELIQYRAYLGNLDLPEHMVEESFFLAK